MQDDATVSDVARIGADGALYVHYAGYGLRRLGADGTVSNVTGISNGNGQLANGAAVGQDPYTVAEPTVVSGDGTVWVANGQLVRIRTGKLHIIDPSLHDVHSVADDGHNGIYFATATRVFHLTAAGQPYRGRRLAPPSPTSRQWRRKGRIALRAGCRHRPPGHQQR